MHIRISQLCTAFIMLVSTVMVSRIAPVSANPTTTLAAPKIVDNTLSPGSIFSIDITITNVSAMWGYMFTLNYDTSVLTATSFSSNYPFEAPQGSPPGGEINDTAGYVKVVYSMPMAESYGFYWSEPDSFPIANIEFSVDARGWSVLDLNGTALADIYGVVIAHDVIDGFFSNTRVKVPDKAANNDTISSTSVIASGTLDQFFERVNLNDTYSANGILGSVHVYTNWVRADLVCFSIGLYRKSGLDQEFLEVGYFHNTSGWPNFEYDFYLFAAWRQNGIYHEITGPPVLPLSDVELEIWWVAGETFEAKADGQTLKMFTFTLGGDRYYRAQGESHYSGNSMRGHIWDLKYYDSSGEHIWQNCTLDWENSDKYDIAFPEGSTNEFYTSGGGVLGDVNGDGRVNINDLGEISAHWYDPPVEGPSGYESNADIFPELVPDGEIDIYDAARVNAHWEENRMVRK